ncbi:MAG: DUF4142 domain-containing protein [Candidatus Sulfotelmatobacter sp.]
MQTPSVILTRFLLVVAIAVTPVLAFAQVGTTSSNSSNDMGQQNTANTPVSMKLNPMDQAFVRDAAQDNRAQIMLGKLAAEKATSSEVKQFADRMVRDHSNLEEKLDQLADNEGVQLPPQPSSKAQMTDDELQKLSGNQFDKTYMSDMLKDHEQDVSAFKHEEHAGGNPQVKEFASQTLPTLESHLREAEKVAPATGVAASHGMTDNGMTESSQ